MTKLTEQVSDTKPMLSERMRASADAHMATYRRGGQPVGQPLLLLGYSQDVAALEQSLAQRTADLGKYGRCLPTCPKVTQACSSLMPASLAPCTCGFAKAMEQQP